ncbi:hypothetical protein T08_8686, partial [Trichinella sp. T8]
LDKLKYELDKELDEIRKKRMKILHLECQYKIKQTADVVDEKDLSNSDTDHHTSPSQRKKLSLSCISEKDILHANDEIQTLKSEEKEMGELSMCFSGIKQVNEIHTLLNEMEECSKSFQQLAESEKESAHHVSNDFISISEEIPNGKYLRGRNGQQMAFKKIVAVRRDPPLNRIMEQMKPVKMSRENRVLPPKDVILLTIYL